MAWCPVLAWERTRKTGVRARERKESKRREEKLRVSESNVSIGKGKERTDI